MKPQCSIIITNYNYGEFLRPAIESALDQQHAQVEVIVVDDGSIDESSQIIASFNDHIAAVMLHENRGQAAAMNAGFARSRGDVVLLLDADDLLLPSAARIAIDALSSPGVSKVHWQLKVIDASGTDHNRLHPTRALPDGDFLSALVEEGPWMCEAPPTSGNAWSRRMLQEIVPIPEADFRVCADAYLLSAAPVFGEIRRIDSPLSCYRLHERNNYWNQPFEEAIRRGVRTYELQCRATSRLLQQRGIAHTTSNWIRHSWWHRLRDAVQDICIVVPEGMSFILVDDDLWGTPDRIDGRIRIPFPQQHSRYAGPPATDDAALRELRQLAGGGTPFMVFGWPAFWYLEHYRGLADYLNRDARCVLRNDRVVALELMNSGQSS